MSAWFCRQSWGEEFQNALDEILGSRRETAADGLKAARECAAMNVTTIHQLALECWRRCPPAMLARDGSPDQTDQLSPPAGASSGCGRHCGKMLRVCRSHICPLLHLDQRFVSALDLKNIASVS